MAGVTELGYIGSSASELDKCGFAAQTSGMEVVDEGELILRYLRMDEHHHRVTPTGPAMTISPSSSE